MKPPELLLLLLASSWAHAGKLQHQVVGGHEAKPHSRPYMAFLKTILWGVSCGTRLGADGRSLPWEHHSYPGCAQCRRPQDSQQLIGVQSYNVHPDYIHSMYVPFNNVLLLKLSRPAIINKYVQVLPLSKTTNDVRTGTMCSVAGWGLIDPDVTTDKLFETNIPIFSRRKCAAMYPPLDDGMICAGDPNRLRNAAQGDSGGPLVCNGVAEGIVSCGLEFPPSVYARVSKYLPWIREIIGYRTRGS